MFYLVMYNGERDEIKLWIPEFEYWIGEEFVPWFLLETCIERGWEVIGRL